MFLLQLPVEETVFTSHGKNVLTSEYRVDMSALVPCNHEEAAHLRIKIRNSNTDVVVLAISIAPTSLLLGELRISYGSSKQVGYLPAQVIATSLG